MKQELIKLLKTDGINSKKQVLEILEQPSIEVVKNKTCKLIDVDNFSHRQCSICGYEKGRMLWKEFNYCPVCGTKIERE